ncbi:hypothetical protein EMIT0P260_130139 [Pseudomonas sp. IT-P260]
MPQHLGRGFEVFAGHFFGDFVGGVQRIFGAVDRGHLQHDVRLNVVGLHAFAVEEHGAELELRLSVALQRGLFEIAQGLIEIAWRILAVVVELTQLVLRLCIPFVRRFLAGGQCLRDVLRLGIEGAATHRRDQQRVAACLCMREQGLKEQQAAQGKGAAGAVHGNRLTSEGHADPSRDPISAHYEISRANLTKSLLVFLLRGEYIAHFLADF